jgi:hypothetical protein
LIWRGEKLKDIDCLILYSDLLSPLMVAAEVNQLNVAKILLNSGANVNAVDYRGWSTSLNN